VRVCVASSSSPSSSLCPQARRSIQSLCSFLERPPPRHVDGRSRCRRRHIDRAPASQPASLWTRRSLSSWRRRARSVWRRQRQAAKDTAQARSGRCNRETNDDKPDEPSRAIVRYRGSERASEPSRRARARERGGACSQPPAAATTTTTRTFNLNAAAISNARRRRREIEFMLTTRAHRPPPPELARPGRRPGQTYSKSMMTTTSAARSARLGSRAGARDWPAGGLYPAGRRPQRRVVAVQSRRSS
jgi:hypothetical protein